MSGETVERSESQQSEQPESRDQQDKQAQEDSNVVALCAWRTDSEVVHQLRRILADAEGGLVTGIVAAAHYHDGEIAYAGAGSMCANPALGVLAANILAKKLLA